MQGHVTILGALLLTFGALGVLAAMLMGMLGVGIPAIVMGTQNLGGDGEMALSIVTVGVFFVTSLICLSSIPGIAAGIGLLGQKRWARPWGFVACVLHLPGIPFMTVLGVYGIWVLMQEETADLLCE